MGRKLFMLVVIVASLNVSVKADEGMWLLDMLHKLNMAEKGMVLTADDIYSINNSSLKDGIVGLGRASNPYRFFCSGEIVSDQGLFITNHHCGYGSIQSHSSPEHDYLTDGFWAMSKKEELANDGMVVSILVRMQEVSDKIIPELNKDMSEADRAAKIREISTDLINKAVDGTHYGAVVKSMYEGNKFYVFVYETFRDIRLVGAPPSSIGKYGGDTDNWMWPRHTGDFSMFRIYADEKGIPAEYSKDNVPYKPKHHFPVSMQGYENGSFAMVMGFPGSTDRYMTSYGIQENLDVTYPVRIALRGKKLDVMKANMNQSDKVRIQYASKYARVSNYWKYFIGQTKGLKRLNVYGQKKAFEDELLTWINADKTRSDKYGNPVKLIEEAYAGKKENAKYAQYYGEGLLGVEIVTHPAGAARSLGNILAAEMTDQNKLKAAVKSLRAGAKGFYKNYDLATDKQMLVEILAMFAANVPVEFQPAIVVSINKKHKGNFAKYAEKLFAKTVFAEEEKYMAFLDNPSLKVLKKDPAVLLFNSIYAKYIEIISAQDPYNQKLEIGRRDFVGAMLEYQKGQVGYPDANSTPRFTYGYVGDYKPADAVKFNYFTTIDGIMEKEDPGNDEFIVADRLTELYKNKDYGQYAAKDGNLRVCFTTNNDITGGNSGSGVFNDRGELIGTAFDGNWEAMSGDIAFEDELQKCINVDIRYVLWVIDKYAGATHLVNEMTLVYDHPIVPEPTGEEIIEVE
jgi:hypothetical protein